MAITSVAGLVEVVGASRLLEPAQQEQLTGHLQGQFTEPKALARALIERGWLSAFQVKQLAQGRGRDLVLGPYVIVDVLGEGGMGIVYKARQRRLERIVALKVIRKEKLSNPDAVRRFQREIRACAQLDHPNIVRALDADQVGDRPFIVMEYVDGTDLAKLVRQSGPLAIHQACEYIRQAALGLQHAHEKGLVHRDIKPSNLLLASGGRKSSESPGASVPGSPALLKILDMGLARATDSGSGELTGTLTHAGAVVGTPDFIAPEQARDSRSADIRSDIYSLGCTLYFILTGQVPFPGGTGMEKLFRHQLEPPAPLNQLRRDVPGDLVKIVDQMMAKRVEDRPQSPREVAELLSPFARSGPAPGREAVRSTVATAPGDESTPPVRRKTSGLGSAFAAPQIRRFRWLIGAAAGGIILLVMTTLLLALWLSGGDSAPNTGLVGKTGKSQTTPGLLDQLDPQKIPPAERIPGLPADVVAVLGQHHFRHWGAIHGAAFSPDGKLVASAGADRVVRVWNLASGAQQHSFAFDMPGSAMPGFGPMSMAFSPDGQKLSLLAPQQWLRTWDVSSGRLIFSLPNGRIDSRPIALSPDGTTAVGVGLDGTGWLVDLAGQSVRGNLPGIGFNPTISIAHDGKTLASWMRGAKAGEIKIWDAATGRERLTIQAAPEPFFSAALAPDGQTIAVLAGHALKIWSTTTGQEVHSRPLNDWGNHLAFLPSGKSVAIVYSNRIVLHELASGTEKNLLRIGAGTAYPQMVFSNDSSKLAGITGWEPVIRVLDLAGQREVHPSEGHNGTVGTMAMTSDGRTLAANIGGFSRPGVRLWDIPTARPRAILGEQVPGTTLLAILPDNQTVLTRSNTHLTHWDISTGNQKNTVNLGPSQYLVTATTPRGETVFTLSQAGRIWDGITLQPRTTLELEKGTGNTAALSADGKRLAVAGYQVGGTGAGFRSRFKLWDVATGTDVTPKLQPFPGAIHQIALTPDGSAIALALGNGSVKLLDAATGAERINHNEPGKGGFHSLLISPDGRTLLSWSQGGPAALPRIHVWDTATGQEGSAPAGHTAGLSTAAFSPDAAILATVDRSGLLLLSNRAGTEIRRVQMPGLVHSMIFAADGRHLVTANANGTIYILRIVPPAQ